MGQKNIKKARKIAEKTAKAYALELAKTQLMDIANAPFRIRWQFCKAILFPKKLKVSAQDREQIKKKSYGGHIPEAAMAQGESK